MIIGAGCDIVEHKEIINLNWGSDISIQKRIFTNKELETYSKNKRISFLAGRFAAKEAVLKCLGTGMQDGIALTDIQVLQTENGKPLLELFNGTKRIADQLQISFWHLSISHSTNHSIAFVVAERSNPFPAAH